MNSRERVMAAFKHIYPDRTPIWEKLIKSSIADQLLGKSSAAENFTYRLERLADGDWEGLTREAAYDLVELHASLGFDLIRLYPNSPPPLEKPKRIGKTLWNVDGVYHELLTSGWIRTWIPEVPKVSEEEQEASLRRVLRSEPPDLPQHDDHSFLMMREARRLMAERGLDLPIFASVYSHGLSTQPEFFLRWFITEKDLVREYYARQTDAGLHLARRLIAEGADIIGLGGDFASDHGPMCSPNDYRELIAPQIACQTSALHELGVFTTNASDGNLWPVIDEFLIDTMVDGFEEIDFAAGMDLTRLRCEYPEKTFIGNIDIRHTLTTGSPAQVREHTFGCIEAGLGPGGHVLMSGNCIHEGVKLNLFMAYLTAYRDFFGLN